jgi:serine/threonine protein kinase/predicted ATPase
MESNAPLQSGETGKPRCCPTCGTPYSNGSAGVGCPVCLFRRVFETEAEREQGFANEEVSGANESCFDHYEIVRRADGSFEQLGRGAMGVTYRALDSVLGHAVALKVIDARFADRPEARERFLREARAAARLRHPNVASVFYYGVRKSDGQCFYAMELVEGETLDTRLRREGPLPASYGLEIVAQVARAMAAAEAQGLVHRDLKPANVMLVSGPDLTVKVIDFGLAKATAASQSDITHGGFVGTPAFASPEQCAGVGVDVRSDLYSLGVTLWVILTGKAPFRGSWPEVMHQQQKAPLPLEQLKGLPQPVVALLQTLLEKDPAHRFQNPTELLKAVPTITDAIDARRRITRQSLQKKPSTTARVGTRKPPVRLAPKKISLARLPITGSEFFGREEDIAFLDRAWANKDLNVVTIVAWAGVGKSTLVNHWLRRLALEQFRSAELVFGWSFYRQGTSEDASSADEFLDAALAWFGDTDPRLGTPWEKGERLARLVARRRTLLILDGLEPLQNPPGPQEGRLREPALQALLRELAVFNTGLCLITSRLPIADIADHEGKSALRLELDQLSGEAGAELLRALGVKGDEGELHHASKEFGGHCLALTLLGSYLADAYNGDIRCRKEISTRLAGDVRQGDHARKVMESYQTWLGEGPELAVLRMLGLFDRPADEKSLETLLKSPAIPGLTESLTGLLPTAWRTILAKLRRARLLAAEDPHYPGNLDTHPLVREYFGEQLRSQRSEAWKESNKRLFHYYQTLAPQLPNSFKEMEPLLSAVICGCNAELYREALHEIYIPRIQRGNACFAANVLGARGALLSVLVHFFEQGCWASPVQTGSEEHSLTAEDQPYILMQTGLYLTATRGMAAPETKTFYERVESLGQSLDRPLLLYFGLMGQWRYSNTIGKLSAALQIAKRVYALAQERNDAELMVGAYRGLAVTLYFLGDFETARQSAIRAIEIWRSASVLSHAQDLGAPATTCLVYEALCAWHFGEIATSKANMMKAIKLSKELNDMHGLASTLYYAASIACFERNRAKVERLASEVIELATRQHFAYWLAVGFILRGWAHSTTGDRVEGISCIENGIRDIIATGAMLGLPYFLGLKAEVLHIMDRTSKALEAINEAEALAERFEQRCWSAELHRLRAVFLTALGAEETQIEASICAAISTAKEQKSVSLEKRAEATYAEYRRQKASGAGGRAIRLPLW